MIYQFVWTKQNEHALEQSVPLIWHGQHIRRMGWSNEIVLGFLEGFDRLSNEYRRKLEALDYHILNCETVANEIVTSQYPELKTYPTTWKYWFIRWNVLHYLAKQNSTDKQWIHLDGDVVLMCDPQELERDVAGKTFMLQGAPALLSINRADWFETWEKELKMFLQNRPNYIALAMVEKAKPSRPSCEFCNECAYTPTWFQDQDLLEFLIAAGRLPQARTKEIFNSRFYWIHNPLLPGQWFEEQAVGDCRRIVESDNRMSVGNKQIAFFHFQSAFTLYCYRWLRESKMGHEPLVTRAKILAEVNDRTLLHRMMLRLARVLGLSQNQSRHAVYQQAFEKNPHTGNSYIADIVNSCWN